LHCIALHCNAMQCIALHCGLHRKYDMKAARELPFLYSLALRCIITSLNHFSLLHLSIRYGYRVVVVESHYLPGGVAHAFKREGFTFDAGPSLWNGMSTKPYNPLAELLHIVGQVGIGS
jgi:hypothetical protein